MKGKQTNYFKIFWCGKAMSVTSLSPILSNFMKFFAASVKIMQTRKVLHDGESNSPSRLLPISELTWYK
ncbi:MAG: hypothetical protein OJF50_001638 [Nitrospira sp.]|jgi:hypothetical protein|nr:hypothetical protein [Nitrospira sp.]